MKKRHLEKIFECTWTRALKGGGLYLLPVIFRQRVQSPLMCRFLNWQANDRMATCSGRTGRPGSGSFDFPSHDSDMLSVRQLVKCAHLTGNYSELDHSSAAKLAYSKQGTKALCIPESSESTTLPTIIMQFAYVPIAYIYILYIFYNTIYYIHWRYIGLYITDDIHVNTTPRAKLQASILFINPHRGPLGDRKVPRHCQHF